MMMLQCCGEDPCSCTMMEEVKWTQNAEVLIRSTIFVTAILCRLLDSPCDDARERTGTNEAIGSGRSDRGLQVTRIGCCA